MADRRREVQELRERIERLDAEVRERLDSRAKLSRQIHGLLESEPASDGATAEWLERVLAGASGDMPVESLRAIFREIRAAGRGIEQPARVAVVGPDGGFCHQSALESFGATTQIVECTSVTEALTELTRGRTAYAMFPFESSVEGLLQSALLTLAETDYVLIGERFTPSIYSLMSKASDAGALEKVYMTAVARAACQRFLDTELPRVSIIDVRTPRIAAELAQEASTSAAILPERCGVGAGLEVLRKNVGDTADALVRYGVASNRPAPRSGNDVSCVLFSTDNHPGSLYDSLRHFAERGINLRRLHSLPARQDGFDYYFYVEISGHASDRSVVTALEAVKRSVRYFRLLGSFPSASPSIAGQAPSQQSS